VAHLGPVPGALGDHIMSKHPVEFFTGNDVDAYWRVTDGNGDPVNRSSEGFRKLGSAKNNLLIFHTILSTDLMALFGNTGSQKGTEFFEDVNGNHRWTVRSANNEIVGASHKGFDNFWEAKNNLLMTYSLISVYIASIAMGK
jgi:hypothetical protein